MQAYREFRERITTRVNHVARNYFVRALMQSQGNVTQAARLTHMDRSNFLRALRRHGLSAQSYRPSESPSCLPSLPPPLLESGESQS